MNALPPAFTSVYRLFLRASSASVLHKNASRKQLRRLFRPVFDAAAQAIRDLEGNQLSPVERSRHERFLETFQTQMDGTLSFLVNSAQYRGVPHRVILNMNRLRRAHVLWVHAKYFSGSKHNWNPKAPVVKLPEVLRPRNRERMAQNRMHERCWDALGEVIRMAEGRHNLSLGRLYLRPWTVEKR